MEYTDIIREIFSILKDTMLVTIMALMFHSLRRDGKFKFHKIVFMMLLVLA
jgi:hypothetical protein